MMGRSNQTRRNYRSRPGELYAWNEERMDAPEAAPVQSGHAQLLTLRCQDPSLQGTMES
jgi:hypothetical protein